MMIRYLVFSCLICSIATAVRSSADLTITAGQIDTSASTPVYRYVYSASDMVSPDKFIQDTHHMENLEVGSHQQVYFVTPKAGERHAEAVFRFDFSDLAYRPTAVTWRDRLNGFPYRRDTSGPSRVVTEWSVDGEHFTRIAELQNDIAAVAEAGDLMDRPRFELPSGTTAVYYRVRFDMVDDDETFVGQQIQWNRTGNNAPLFLAEFELEPLQLSMSQGDISLHVTYPHRVKHLVNGVAYPRYVYEMDSDAHWIFLGALDGHSGEIKTIDAPDRPGQKALYCRANINLTNPDAPNWLAWQHELQPQLSIVGVTEAVFDVYPIDRIEFPLMVQLGQHRGFGIVPATWKSIGNLEPGQWHEVRISVRPQRPAIDAIRLTFNRNKPGVPHKQDVRFVIDNFRLEPAQDHPATTFIDEMSCSGSVNAAYLQQSSPAEISQDDTVSFDMELDVVQVVESQIQVTGRNVDTGQDHTWEIPLSLRSPFTQASLHIEHPTAELGFGQLSFDLQVIDAEGTHLAQASKRSQIMAYSESAMNQQRQALLQQTQMLVARAHALTKRGIEVAEPGVTLQVATWFLENGGFIQSDFTDQKARTRALELMEHVAGLLSRAESELNAREKGDEIEPVVQDYQAGVPFTVEHGVLKQNGKPLLLIGPLSGNAPFEAYRTIGFNSMSQETRIRDWYNGKGKYDAEWMDQYLQTGLDNNLSVHLLLSSHYPPDPMPEAFEGANSTETGVGMFPWDVLSPQTEEIFEDWYKRMIPHFQGKPALASFGTANEPGYVVSQSASNFADAFAPWLAAHYGSIEQANARWGSNYESFEAIDLPSFFTHREAHVGAEYDWQRFVDDQVAPFFQKRKERLESATPGVPVWTKLMGHEQQFGFTQLNEHSSVAVGQNVLGTDSHDKLWLDYFKSIDPSKPVFNTEWHFMANVDPNNQDMLAKRMFEGVVHGTQVGLIWTWSRKPWDTPVLGADQSIMRWPRTIDAVGRTSLKLRSLADPLMRLAHLDGGRVRILYSLAANTHQQLEYIHGLDEVYKNLNQNASGHRFVFSHRLQGSDLEGVELLAMPKTRYIEANSAEVIAQWVRSGGTLWVTERSEWLDPWGMSINDMDSDLREALGSEGAHAMGDGHVVVGDAPPLSKFCTGPWAQNVEGQAVRTVDIRHTGTREHGFISITNDSDKAVTITLGDAQGRWQPMNSEAYDLWNRQHINLDSVIKLPAYGVKLLEY